MLCLTNADFTRGLKSPFVRTERAQKLCKHSGNLLYEFFRDSCLCWHWQQRQESPLITLRAENSPNNRDQRVPLPCSALVCRSRARGGFRALENEAFAQHPPHHATAQVPPPDFLVWLLSGDDARARIYFTHRSAKAQRRRRSFISAFKSFSCKVTQTLFRWMEEEHERKKQISLLG